MSQELWSDVERYLVERFVPADDDLEFALQASAAAGLPAINVSPNQGRFLQLLVRMIGARRVLEVGTLGGYSTLWMAKALPPGGQLITLEFEPRHAAVAQANIDRAGLTRVIDIRIGRAIDALRQLEQRRDEPFDLVFIDADKPSTPEYFESAVRLTYAGSVIVVDNVVRKGGVLDDGSDDASIQGMRRFCELAGRDPRVSLTALQTVGSKGYDGFAIARVN